MRQRLLKRRKTSRWQTFLATLTWWRMRYVEPVSATQGLQAIAANLPDKTLAIAVDNVSLPTIWIGLPTNQEWGVSALRSYGVQLVAVDKLADSAESPSIPTDIASWQRVTHWPTAPAWAGLLSDGQLYNAVVPTEAGDDALAQSIKPITWPIAEGQQSSRWQLPPAQFGIAARLPAVAVEPLPKPLAGVSEPSQTAETVQIAASSTLHYLGKNGGRNIFAPDRVQVWGDARTLHGWTIQLILQHLTQAETPLVVIDGRGKMATQLPLYKPFVATLKGEQLHYVHIEDDLRRQGFNPLQPLGWESVEQTADRWQRWLGSLGIWPSGIVLDRHKLCLHAVNSSVNNLSTLIRWFHQVDDIPQTAHTHIQRALRQVQQSVRYAMWLRRPRPLLERPCGLVFACSVGTDTVKRTMTAALLDAALTLPDVTLVLMSVPNNLLKAIPNERLPRRVIMINGVRLQDSLVGIGRIADPIKRQQMVQRAFRKDGALSRAAMAELQERFAIAPANSVFWLTNPPVQTTV